MKQVAMLLSTILLISCITSCASHEAKLQESGAKLLSQSELENLFSKEFTIRYSTAKSSGTTTYTPDGKMVIKGSGYSDTGEYKIENVQYCSKLYKLRNYMQCFKVYKINEKEYQQVSTDGRFAAKFYIEN